LLYGACGCLALAAVLHAGGYGEVSRRLAASGLDAAWSAGLRAAWMAFTLQLLALVALLVTACVRPTSVGRSALFWCGLLPFADSVVLLVLVGLFPLTALLAFAALAVFGAIFTRPHRKAPALG
jgi:hypothetical protein